MGWGCCRYPRWPPEYEAAANDIMYERSKNKLGGICSHHKRCYYNRRCANYIFIWFVIVMSGMLQAVFQNISHIIQFAEGNGIIETKCTTLETVINGDRFCDVDKLGIKETYKCLNIKVTYETNDKTITGFLLYEATEETRVQRCAVFQKECNDLSPKFDVEELQSDVGTAGTQFVCYHNAQNVSEITYKKYSSDFETAKIRTIIAGSVGGFLLVADIILLMVIGFSCGFTIPFARYPPRCVEEEVERRKARIVRLEAMPPPPQPQPQPYNNFTTDYSLPPPPPYYATA